MKETFLTTLIIMFCMLAIPLSSLSTTKSPIVSAANTTSDVPYQKQNVQISFEKIKVLKDEQILDLSIKDYVFGVVAAEMPAMYHDEALKAQAVAAYTFACYRKNSNTNNEYDITADAETAQCFITREEARTRWGESAAQYEKKIDDCVSAVLGQILIYNNAPIFAAYHAISSGVTNPCADVWGSDLAYLQSVDSIGDKLADGYLSEASFTPEQINEKLKSITAANGDAQNYFSNAVTNNNGYVKKITYCGNEVSGAQISKLLSLRSSNFTISFSDNKFTFLVKGYGHGVGMSQTGANYMAKQGSTYEEILLHYYNGATLQKN